MDPTALFTRAVVVREELEPVVIDLAVSIVNYRTAEMTSACVEAVARECTRSRLTIQVTVSDNGSGDDSADLIATRFPWARLIRHDRNLGFGAAHNRALRGTAARYLLILNSDAALQPGALAHLVAFLDHHPRVAVAGPRLRYPNGATQSSRRRFPALATFFVESTQVQRFWPRNPLLRRYYMADLPDDREMSVDWLVGACLCVRASAAAEIGLFDERFFMYSEEMDWCRRFHAAGWDVANVPGAVVEHLEGGSSSKDLLARDIRFQESKLAYVAKWHGRGAARALRAYLLGEYLLRGVEEGVKLRLGSRPEERRARLRIIGGYLRHAFSLPVRSAHRA